VKLLASTPVTGSENVIFTTTSAGAFDVSGSG
jgi:hypothetical protein